MRSAVFDRCGHSIAKNELKDRKGSRCKLCHNKANREAAARRRVREAFTRAAERMGVLR
jgi:hypothetical protein